MSFSPHLVRAKKSLGQNFLVDDDALSKIVSACEVTGRNVVEVGPGYGALTERLLPLTPRSLTLVELDADMVAILKDRTAKGNLSVPEGTGFEILSADVLTFEPKAFPYRVIANIPYYITSPILERFLYDLPVRPEEMVILMQKEVADRIVAKDGKESGLSLFCKNACFSIECVARVASACFRPAPKVDSAVLRFVCRPNHPGNERDITADARFLKTVRVGFSSPRKKLASNLANGFWIPKETVAKTFAELGIDENERPERVALETWKRLSDRIG